MATAFIKLLFIAMKSSFDSVVIAVVAILLDLMFVLKSENVVIIDAEFRVCIMEASKSIIKEIFMQDYQRNLLRISKELTCFCFMFAIVRSDSTLVVKPIFITVV